MSWFVNPWGLVPFKMELFDEPEQVFIQVSPKGTYSQAVCIDGRCRHTGPELDMATRHWLESYPGHVLHRVGEDVVAVTVATSKGMMVWPPDRLWNFTLELPKPDPVYSGPWEAERTVERIESYPAERFMIRGLRRYVEAEYHRFVV